MGTAIATSAFVDKPLTGNVYAVEQAGVAYLPGLVADLRGRVNAQIKIATQIIGGKYIRSTVTDVPDLPVSSFSMSLNGGDKRTARVQVRPLLQERESSSARMNADVTFTAHSGKRTESKPRIAVEGCAPAATASLRRAAGRKATLKLTVERHPDAKNIEGLSVTLPRGATLVSKRMKGKARRREGPPASTGATVRAAGKRTLQVSKISGKGTAASVTITLRRGAVRLSGKVRRLARKGKRPKVRIKVLSRDTKRHAARVAGDRVG